MWNEFKKFALKGNVLDLAVGVIIGGAFGKIVTSLVNDMIMPLFGILLGGINLSKLSYPFIDANIKYGIFLQNIINFFIISFSIFVFIRLVSRFRHKEEVKEEIQQDIKEELLREIRDLLKVQAKEKENL
ncbi:large conductance mechanosensitive channel protein MscL [Mesobacillus zeae]|uniref:Large-conductance mechanosensitive channel n=1 Tax=Mesobacillus zeae TaxID=1917180 RepID=A0A398BBU2_9BACI|nr:large conductance mechanosensitive channel protein MscL [Mesobacillus zeae]RID85156.1 large conductance mechanosensitive channel protein MscL [Mesobacillus zeae]